MLIGQRTRSSYNDEVEAASGSARRWPFSLGLGWRDPCQSLRRAGGNVNLGVAKMNAPRVSVKARLPLLDGPSGAKPIDLGATLPERNLVADALLTTESRYAATSTYPAAVVGLGMGKLVPRISSRWALRGNPSRAHGRGGRWRAIGDNPSDGL